MNGTSLEDNCDVLPKNSKKKKAKKSPPSCLNNHGRIREILNFNKLTMISRFSVKKWCPKFNNQRKGGGSMKATSVETAP